jgi:hypothetical protein
MRSARQSTAIALTIVMFVATAWCICAPASNELASATSAPCCRVHNQPANVPQRPAQDCPSCSWSVLRSAGVLKIDTTIDQPTMALAFAALPSPPGVKVLSRVVPSIDAAAPSPPKQTLFDLHCQLLT